MRVAFAGHASFLIQAAGLNILTDPVWSERASPFGFAGPKRVNPPGIGFDDLPRVDVVLVSHAHYDHMDLASIARLWARDQPKLVAPLGNDAIIRAHDAAIAVTTADWGDAVALSDAVGVHLVPVHHWAARGVLDRNHALWCGFVLTGAMPRTFFAGDTGFDGGRPFRDVARRFGAPDLALLPIGAYEPRWFMAPQHMNPDEAVQGFSLLAARHALGYHWGTFRLTNEGVEAPARDLATALAAHGVAAERFAAMRPGQVWAAPAGA
jgi:L-ascorbate metabolism protein UlaG (beta-lactamase superfamily)